MSGPGGKREGAGRPKHRMDDERVKMARTARRSADKAIQALVDNLTDKNGGVRNSAATALLDRGYGKAPQEVILEEGTEDDQIKSRGLSALLDLATESIDTGDEDTGEVSGED